MNLDLGRYRALLAIPQARPLVLGAVLSRQSAMLVLAQVLLVRQATNSYAAAGASTAAFALGQGLSAPIWGRLIDRHGPCRTIGALALLDGIALLALVLAADAGAAPETLILLAGAVGVLGPPTVPAMRTMWSRLLPDPGERQTAYALETALTEVAFVSGPLATAALVTVGSPAVAVLTGAAFLVSGSLLFAFAAPGEGVGAPSSADLAGLAALRSPSIRVLVAVWVPLGATFAALEIVVPAFCQRAGVTGLAGVLLAATASGAVVGGLIYGALPAPPSLPRRLRRACLVFALALIPVAASAGVLTVAVLLFVAGAAFSPIATASSQWIDEFGSGGTATESFTWLLTAYMAGGALGAQAAGFTVNGFGVGLALALPAAFALCAAVCAVVGTWRLRPGRVRGPAPLAASSSRRLLGSARALPLLALALLTQSPGRAEGGLLGDVRRVMGAVLAPVPGIAFWCLDVSGHSAPPRVVSSGIRQEFLTNTEILGGSRHRARLHRQRRTGPGGAAATGERRLRFTLRPLNPAGLELIKAVEPAVPAFSVTDRELDVYVSDRSELERVLAKFTPQWRQVVEVERAESQGADSEQ